MRAHQLLPLAAALATAFVIPDDAVINRVVVESDRSGVSKLKDSFADSIEAAKGSIHDVFEAAFDRADDALDSLTDYAEEKYTDAEFWLQGFREAREQDFEAAEEMIEEGLPSMDFTEIDRHTRDWYDDLGVTEVHEEDEDDDHHHKPHHPPHHRPHHPRKPTLSVYQMIKKSKYTTKLAKLVDKFPDIAKGLNGTKSNFTFFAPTDDAFKNIHNIDDIPKEFLLSFLKYHIVPDIYPARRVLGSRTLATVLHGDGLSDKPHENPQRLAVTLTPRPTLNYYSPLVALDIYATNGIVHGIGKGLFPAPKAAVVVQLVPGTFSTLELGLWKTGLIFALNDTSNHLGGTLFAPSNRAFERLGPRANGFLFSPYGRKYLKALLKYHVVPNVTLYSDALYVTGGKKDGKDSADAKRTFHIELDTLLEGKSLSVDVAEWYRFVDIRINGFNHVGLRDAAVYDGVIHVMGSVLIPPKEAANGKAILEESTDDIDVEELKSRLQPYVDEDTTDEDKFDMKAVQKAMSEQRHPYQFAMEL